MVNEFWTPYTRVMSQVLEHVGALTEDDSFKSAKEIITRSSDEALSMRGLANGFVFQIASLNQSGVKTSSVFSLFQVRLVPGTQDTREELQKCVHLEEVMWHALATLRFVESFAGFF
jgi:hypothetical protein